MTRGTCANSASANIIRCQTVTNVRAFEENEKILVVYDLFSAEEKQFFIRLMSSIDNGKSYKQINNIVGDVNKLVKSGADRSISFSLEKDTVRRNYVFKVLAFPDKRITTFESMNTGIKVRLLNVVRDGKNLNFNVRINCNEIRLAELMLSNFTGKDLAGNVCTEWIVLEGNIKKIYPNAGLDVTIQLINAESNDFDKMGFKLSILNTDLSSNIIFKSFSVGLGDEEIN